MNPDNLENGTITTGGTSVNLGTDFGLTARAVPPWRPTIDTQERNPFEEDDPIALRELQELFRASRVAEAQQLRSFRSPFSQDFTRDYDEQTMSDIAVVMKERHLSKSERQAYHQPKNDWKESPKGDVCKNASTLEVEDIITKYK